MAGLKLVTQVAGFDLPYVLEMKKQKIVCRANRLLLVKFYDNKKVKSPYNWVISLLTQPQVANQQQQQKVLKGHFYVIALRQDDLHPCKEW